MLRYNQTRELFTQLVSSLPLGIPFVFESVVCSCAGYWTYLFNGPVFRFRKQRLL